MPCTPVQSSDQADDTSTGRSEAREGEGHAWWQKTSARSNAHTEDNERATRSAATKQRTDGATHRLFEQQPEVLLVQDRRAHAHRRLARARLARRLPRPLPRALVRDRRLPRAALGRARAPVWARAVVVPVVVPIRRACGGPSAGGLGVVRALTGGEGA